MFLAKLHKCWRMGKQSAGLELRLSQYACTPLASRKATHFYFSSILHFILTCFLPFSESHRIQREEKKRLQYVKNLPECTKPDHLFILNLMPLDTSKCCCQNCSIPHLFIWVKLGLEHCRYHFLKKGTIFSQIYGPIYLQNILSKQKLVASVTNYKSWLLNPVFYMRNKHTLGMTILLLTFHHSVANSNNSIRL